MPSETKTDRPDQYNAEIKPSAARHQVEPFMSAFRRLHAATCPVSVMSHEWAAQAARGAALLGGPRRIADYEDLNWLASESDEAIVGVLTTPRDRAAEALRESA